MFTRDNVIGFFAGLAVSAAGFVYYKKNQAKVDSFLAGKGINMPLDESGEGGDASLEDLVAKKERLEDLIAERELGDKE